jgi:hypothetical protein
LADAGAAAKGEWYPKVWVNLLTAISTVIESLWSELLDIVSPILLVVMHRIDREDNSGTLGKDVTVAKMVFVCQNASRQLCNRWAKS